MGMKTLNWGIIGTGAIAKTFAKGLAGSTTGRLVAVGSRGKEKAEQFARDCGGGAARAHGSYEALLADKEVQAVYISTPHPTHAHWAIKCAEAGKHILCEKPIGMNHAEAMAIVEAAVAHDVFLMEAFMYRCHPQTRKLVQLLWSGAIGDVRVIQASFAFHWPKPWNAESRLTNNALGGGGILDVGCYCTSMARLIAGAAMGKQFAEPVELKAVGQLGATGCDEYASALLKFNAPSGAIVASVTTGVQVNTDNSVRIYGSDGNIVIPSPWVPARDGGATKILLTRSGAKEPDEIVIESPQGLYSIEADTVAANIESRQCPFMRWDDTLGNMRVLDQWRSAIGLVYESEKPAASSVTVSGRALAVSQSHNMKYGSVAHLEKKISRLIMGCDNQANYPHAQVMFDDFFSRGGNCFDTAYVYGGGHQERLLGQWVKARNVRDQVVVIVKGAHTPMCDPTNLSRQLRESLDRLKFDRADIYMMHRDNPEIPVKEFIDCLNEHVRAGRISTFGGSNWALSRVQEANDYAKKAGKQGFSVVSNNFSLARMVDPVWAGCIAASDAQSREWLTKNQFPLLAWSSQARGFFLPGKAAPEKKEDEELVRCWYAEDNFRRLERVNELAKKRNVLPINIALAYVLNQPFPAFALIGPRELSETRTSLPALDVHLCEQERRWLNLEEG
jgi:predicted dehydrogenase/aryl-alcohol dehydrogenase-like predicted oxidoreductase